jgi:hypothetical protein
MLCAAFFLAARCLMIPCRLLTMSSTLLLAAALAGSAPPAPAAPAGAAPPAAPAGAPAAAAAATGRRIEVTSREGKPYPYSIEVPAGWQVQVSKNKDVPGVFLGPPAIGELESDPHLIYIRVSPASMLDPEAVVANIKKSQPADASWSAPLVEVRDIGGVRGVLVRMDSGSGEQARSTLVLKMPLGMTSLDFMASASRAEFERLLPGYQRAMFSVLPAK